MVVKTIVHFEIPATDVERLAEFYRRVFGWEIEKGPMPDMEYWLISTGPQGESVGGGMYRKMRPTDQPRNFVMVDAIDEAIRAFTDAGGTEAVGKMEVPGMGWSYIGADPEGNLIGLFQATSPGPPPGRRRRARSSPAK